MKGIKDKKTIERLLAKVAILHEAALNVVWPDPENAVGDNNRNWTILEQLSGGGVYDSDLEDMINAVNTVGTDDD